MGRVGRRRRQQQMDLERQKMERTRWRLERGSGDGGHCAGERRMAQTSEPTPSGWRFILVVASSESSRPAQGLTRDRCLPACACLRRAMWRTGRRARKATFRNQRDVAVQLTRDTTPTADASMAFYACPPSALSGRCTDLISVSSQIPDVSSFANSSLRLSTAHSTASTRPKSSPIQLRRRPLPPPFSHPSPAQCTASCQIARHIRPQTSPSSLRPGR